MRSIKYLSGPPYSRQEAYKEADFARLNVYRKIAIPRRTMHNKRATIKGIEGRTPSEWFTITRLTPSKWFIIGRFTPYEWLAYRQTRSVRKEPLLPDV